MGVSRTRPWCSRAWSSNGKQVISAISGPATRLRHFFAAPQAELRQPGPAQAGQQQPVQCILGPLVSILAGATSSAAAGKKGALRATARTATTAWAGPAFRPAGNRQSGPHIAEQQAAGVGRAAEHQASRTRQEASNNQVVPARRTAPPQEISNNAWAWTFTVSARTAAVSCGQRQRRTSRCHERLARRRLSSSKVVDIIAHRHDTGQRTLLAGHRCYRELYRQFVPGLVHGGHRQQLVRCMPDCPVAIIRS